MADDDWFERALRENENENGEEAETGDDGGRDERRDGATDAGPDDGPAARVDADASGRDEFDDGGDGLFDDDFASAFSAAGEPTDGGGEFGFDGFDDEFESEIPRVDLGIEGLDSMIQGGVPERSLVVTIGEAGTGKTTFGLQFLHRALSNGERAVFITLEQDSAGVVATADEKGWEFSRHVEEGRLAIVDFDPVEMATSLASIRNELPVLVEEFGATRLVLDSVSLLEMMYDDQATRRTEVYDFTRSLKRAGVTTMLTSEASERNPYASRHGIIEYLTDAVFVLRYIRSDEFRETRLAVEIQKIRDANHSRETKPYEITNGGISVYRQANIF